MKRVTRHGFTVERLSFVKRLRCEKQLCHSTLSDLLQTLTHETRVESRKLERGGGGVTGDYLQQLGGMRRLPHETRAYTAEDTCFPAGTGLPLNSAGFPADFV